MRNWGALLLILCISTVSCASVEYGRIPLEGQWDYVVVQNTIPIESEGDVVLSSNDKKQLAMQLDRFPNAWKHIDKLVISDRLKPGILGLYKSNVIYVLHMDMDGMKQVLWHEVAHANSENITSEQLYEWCEVISDRLDEAGLEDVQHDKWDEKAHYEGFPSAYSTRNVWEFMAEHVMFHTINPERHKTLWPQEAALIEKHGLAPKY